MLMKDKPNPIRRLARKLLHAQQRHQERSQPSGFGFSFADRVDFLHPAHWGKVTSGGSAFMSPDVLRVIENHGPENLDSRYALVFRDQIPVAALAAQLITVKGNTLHRDPAEQTESQSRNILKRAIAPVTGKATANFKGRALIAGNVLSWGFHGIAFAEGEVPALVWPGIAEALYRIRRAERLTGQTGLSMVKDVTPAQDGLEALRRFSYRPLETEPNMVLEVQSCWRNYDDYLLALDAKYRRNAKDQMKKLANAGCVVERLEDPQAAAARLHELYLAVHDRAAVRLVTLRESFLPALSDSLGDRFRVNVVRRGDELLGFVSTIRDGDTAIAYYIGFDRASANEGLPIYLRLLHSTVGDAIEWKCRKLSLGRTALEPKAALGAKPEPMSVWMRHRLPAVNWALRGLLGAIPHEEAPQRNPFKTQPQES